MPQDKIALVGAPNCGKSTLFNALTGGRAKIANYPGATVEMRKGLYSTQSGQSIEIIDLPGFYGLAPRSIDGQIALDILKGEGLATDQPDRLLVMLDANNILTHLHLVLQLKCLERPMLLVLNMFDLATRNGLEIDIEKLETLLGIPVVSAHATRKKGREGLLVRLDRWLAEPVAIIQPPSITPPLKRLQSDARTICKAVIISEPVLSKFTRIADRFTLHPIAGPFILATILFTLFQAVFAWSAWPMDKIDAAVVGLHNTLGPLLGEGWAKDLLLEGIITGVGSVIIFLPQILILFAFILLLEASGYMARAAFMMDGLMIRVGLNGRAFIPLLSSFACAIPGIMAARTIEGEKDRLTTILIAPLMTCSARLPVYGVLIAAFIPAQNIGPFNLHGLVLFGLYLSGVLSAILIAFILKRTLMRRPPQPMLMELPAYKWPDIHAFLIGLFDRAMSFVKRAGTIVLGTNILLWFLVSYPSGADNLRDSYAGKIGGIMEKALMPIGFNLEMAIALIPGMAAREVAVGALGTVYAVQNAEDNQDSLVAILQSAWALPSALAFLAWYVFAPQCFATLAVIKRETNSWGWVGFAFIYLIGLAYFMAGATFHISAIWLS